MQLQTNLRLEQKQSLIMTPRLQQALDILQLPAQDLRELLKQEAEKNPLLEVEDSENLASLEEKTSGEWEEFFANSEYGLYQEWKEEKEKINFSPVQNPSREEILFQQVGLVLNEDSERKIAEFLIFSLDEKGYLEVTPEYTARLLNEDRKKVEKVRKLLMQQEPSGHGARGVQEAMCFQLRDMEAPREDRELAEQILRHHWQQMVRGNWEGIRKQFAGGKEAFNRGMNLIRRLSPYPSACFEEETPRYLEPDIIVNRLNKEWQIIMNDNIYPRLQLSPFYRNFFKGPTDCPETKEFLEKKLNGVKWLVSCIEQRRITLYRITEVLLEMQADFFEKGKKALRPLTLREVAEKLELHISTIWRATSGKYLQTPYGIFELRYFFSSGVENHSAISIKEIIKELIEKESPEKPLSDQEISRGLRERGIGISRRTVAKYRQQMEIPSSGHRRKYYS